MKSYIVFWTHCSSHCEYSGDTTIEARSEEEAEEKFFKTRTEMNPYKGNFVGYVVDNILAK